MAYGSGTEMNGSASKEIDKEDVLSPPRATSGGSKQSGFFLSTLQSILRLFLWWSVFIIAFRCPSSLDELTADSYSICRPYLQVRSHISPHLEPSYNQYVKPYVEKAQPHFDRFNEQVYSPAVNVTSTYYNTYAASHVDWANDKFTEQWAANVEPKLNAGKQWVLVKYEEQLSPHLNKAAELADPHIKHAQEQLMDVYETTLVPVYEKVLPHVQELYAKSHHITTMVIVPYVSTAQNNVSAFFYRRIWPRLVILYGENVEPQVMRITERLGRYKDSKKLSASIVEIEAESSITSAASRASSIAASSSIDVPTAEASNASVEPNETETREKIEADLKTWQERFAKAADTGAEDLGERVKEITSRQIKNQAHGVGKALLTELDTTVQASMKELKNHINTSITKLPENASHEDEDILYEELLSFIKTTGEKIRKKAIAVRTWKQNYDNETSTLVKAALDSTLDVIDNIRELGLQEIGMRLGWMEGVTYKDWSKYTVMKKTFDTWREKVEDVALKHTSLEEAKEEGETVQDNAMEMAKSAANELKRLKDVAKWKVWSHDASEDFSTRSAPERALKSVQSALSSGVDAVSENINDLSASASEAIVDATSLAQSGAQVISESASSLVSSAQSKIMASSESTTPKVWGGAMASSVNHKDEPQEDDSWTDRIESMLDAAGDRYSELTSVISEALLKPTSTQGSAEIITSLAGEQYAMALSAASSVLFGTPQPVTESVASVVSNKFADAVTAASYAIYGTPTPILESIAAQATSVIGDAASQAHEAYASVTSMASVRLAEGLSQAAEQYTNAKIAVGLQPPPLHQQYISEAQRRYYEGIGLAHDQYTRFIGAASTAVYGTPTPVLQGYVDEASKQIFGTPAPAYKSALSELGVQYSSAFAIASENLDMIRSSVSDILKTSKDPMAVQLLAQASSSYEMASSKASEMLSKASERISIAYLGSSTGVVESVASKVSENIIGTETPWNEAMASHASATWSSMINMASEQIYGTPTPFVESAWHQAGEYAAQATEAAASQYKVLEEIVSELIVGKEPDFTESVMSRLSTAYYTGWASASSVASEVYASASSGVVNAAESVQSVASKIVSGEKDEL